MSESSERIYQLHVSLDGSNPPIWRRILVSGDASLAKLHLILQAVLGWQNYHLHMFKIDGQIYGDPEDDEWGDLGTKDEHHYALGLLLREKGSILEYEYDFGDSWIHRLEVEEILSRQESSQVPLCVAGERAGPPEDVGGIGGYQEYVKAVKNPRHREHREWLAWRGPFDPEKFDLQAVNARLFWLSDHERANRLGLNAADNLSLVQGYFPSLTYWAGKLDEAQYAMAEEIPMRRDMIVLLSYLRNNKVTSTTTGNLPLRAAKEISAQFVHPPEWEDKVGEHVFRVRSSADIWSIYFAMVLAQVGELISIGKSRRIRLMPAGETFFSVSAPLQSWYLLAVWWTRVNWLIAFPYEGMGDQLPYDFGENAGRLLLEQPLDESIPIEPFADHLIEEGRLVWHSQEKTHTQSILRSSIQQMVIRPLSALGVLTPIYESRKQWGSESKTLVSFRITRFGRNLLESLIHWGRWADTL